MLFDGEDTDPNVISIAYSDIQGGLDGIGLGEGEMDDWGGNIDLDPWFCDPDANIYTLAENSPCLGSGEFTQDIGALGQGCTFPVAIDENPSVPNQLTLHKNYPNPFNPSTTISYELPGAGWVSLVIYDVIGRQITTLLGEDQTAGSHSFHWNARDQQGHQLEAGIYLYRILYTDDNGTEFSKVQKLSLLK